MVARRIFNQTIREHICFHSIQDSNLSEARRRNQWSNYKSEIANSNRKNNRLRNSSRRFDICLPHLVINTKKHQHLQSCRTTYSIQSLWTNNLNNSNIFLLTTRIEETRPSLTLAILIRSQRISIMWNKTDWWPFVNMLYWMRKISRTSMFQNSKTPLRCSALSWSYRFRSLGYRKS